MVDFSRLVRDGMRLFRMYQRYSKSQGAPPASRGQTGQRAPRTKPRAQHAHDAARTAGTPLSRPYAGDYRGPLHPVYSPQPDGQPDPGEVVWTWVPYEEDHSRGKDRPVLIVDHRGDFLLCLMLTSKEHDSIAYDDPDYVNVGTGSWDSKGRASQVKLDRVIQVLPQDVRREGSVLTRQAFDAVARELASRQ